MSTAKQRQEIGYMRKLLGLDEDTYREILAQYNGATSSKDLSIHDAYQLLNNFRDKAREIKVFKPKKSTTFKQYKYNNLGNRKGMASPAQLRKIEAMWFDVSIQSTDEARKDALKSFIKRITNKDSINFLTHNDVKKLINAMNNMEKGN